MEKPLRVNSENQLQFFLLELENYWDFYFSSSSQTHQRIFAEN